MTALPAHRRLAPLELSPTETATMNGRWMIVIPRLSIIVPTYRDDPLPLITSLGKCRAAEAVELILYDDGSSDPVLVSRIQTACESFPGAACTISNSQNNGRAFARNRLDAIARADWRLYLDADMLPDGPDFLANYLEMAAKHPAPGLVVGGFSMKRVPQSGATSLHRAQSVASECVSAEVRATDAGRYVFTSNVLVHRDVMMVVPFDDGFTGWGWEDVDWGLRAARRFPIHHIDNTASHLGLETAPQLLRKYAGSAENFLRIVRQHPDAMGRTALFKAAWRLSRLPGRSILRGVSRILASLPSFVPVKLRLLGLKLFRACVYAEIISE